MAIVLVALLGAGFGVLIMALALLAWTPFARLARGLTLELNTTLFVQAAEALGCSRSFIVWRHIVPNMAGPMFAMFFLRFGHLLITAAGLSFLGLGAQPPTADWGAMLSDALPFMQRVPLLVLAPGLMIFVMALTVNRRRPRRVARSRSAVTGPGDGAAPSYTGQGRPVNGSRSAGAIGRRRPGERNSDTVLAVRDLRTYFATSRGEVKAVDGVDLTVRRGETLAIVGESGSGKTVTAMSLMGLVRPPGRILEWTCHASRYRIADSV